MSNQALIDIRAKIHRANHHFDDFKAEFGLGPPTEDGLWLLGGLDYIDKHRTMLLLCNRVSISGVAHSRDGLYTSPFSFPKQPVQTGTQLLTFEWPQSVPPAAVEVNDVTPWIVIDGTDGLCDNRSVFRLFRLIESAVNTALGRFQRMIFFS